MMVLELDYDRKHIQLTSLNSDILTFCKNQGHFNDVIKFELKFHLNEHTL